jgi:hypothetical protein
VDLAGDASAPFGRPLALTAQEIYQYLSPTPTWPDPMIYSPYKAERGHHC